MVFTPAEVDFLFPGPFTRRQLLAYKIGKSLVGLLFSSFLMSVVFLRHASSWPFAWVGLFLGMFFMQLFSMAITLIAQAAGERAYTNTRKIILIAVIALIAAVALPALKGGGRIGFFQMAQSLQQSRVGSVLLAPLEVFGHLFVASHLWPDGVIYSAAAIGIIGVLTGVVFYLDADYLEAAAAKSQAVYARLQRVRKGGLSAMAKPGKKGKFSIPQLPNLRGAGPIGWRQMTTALRNSRGLFFILLILTISVGPLVLSHHAEEKANHPGDPVSSMTGGLVIAMGWITLVVAAWLRFDFRGDLDLLDHLKSLPISANAISIGQLITPVLMLTICHWIIIASVAVIAQRVDFLLASAAALSLPFNGLLFGVENFIFLLFPTRAAANPADFQGYGRQLLMLFAKGGILVLTAGVAAAVGAIAHFLFKAPPAVAVAISGLLLCGFAVATVPVVAWAYTRFDVSGDVPS